MTNLASFRQRGGDADSPASPQEGSVAHPRVLEASQLLAGHAEVVLRHGAELYRLRLTRQNRLILTK